MIKILCIGLLISLVSCGDDVANNNRNRPKTERTEEPITETTSNLSSQMIREKGATILTYDEEAKKTLANEVPGKLYRLIPLMEKDDEGSAVNVTSMDDIGRPDTNCGNGVGFTGVKARISDCSKKNGDKAIWDGTRYGAAGEGTWKLVTKTISKEFWLDEKTGMIWSHAMTAVNWCMASGNTENNTTDAVVDCNDIGDALSSCAGKSQEEVGEQIKWRLPTRNDFLQADINGLRLVMKKESETTGLWTATMRAASAGRKEAWVYNSKEGTLTSGLLTSERHVRCIGTPVL